MSKPIYIHAGAHRTGTSSFQQCLHDNHDVLKKQGIDIAYPGRDGVKGGKLRLRLPSPRHIGKSKPDFAAIVASHLDQLSPNPDQALILAEENIPGRMFHFNAGEFFPAAEVRFAALAKALRNPPKHILYVVRSYDEIYVSGFRKRAEDNPVNPFSKLSPHYMAMDRGWPEIVALMRDILKPERISVLPYERRGQSRELLNLLVPGLSVDELSEPSKLVNLSATDAALEALQKRYHAGQELTRPEWKTVVQAHAHDREPRGFAAFSEKDTKTLKNRYQIDLDRIKIMDGVEFL